MNLESTASALFAGCVERPADMARWSALADHAMEELAAGRPVTAGRLSVRPFCGTVFLATIDGSGWAVATKGKAANLARNLCRLARQKVGGGAELTPHGNRLYDADGRRVTVPE